MKKLILTLALFVLAANTLIAKPAPQYSFGVRIAGKGKPMILIPGFKGSADTYNDVVAHYQGRYKCYVITLAGFNGQPPSGLHDHLFQKQRDDIISYIVNEHLQKPVLIGFSFGGILATWIAVTRPDLIGRYIDIDGTPFDAALQNDHFNKDSLLKVDSARYARMLNYTTVTWHKRDSAFHSAASIKIGREDLKKLVNDTARINEILVWDAASDFRTAALMDVESEVIDMRDDVAKLRYPVLVLGSWTSWGYKNKAEGEADYQKQWAKAKDVTIVFSEKGKHFLMYEDLDWMLAQMDEFLMKRGSPESRKSQ